MSRQVYLYGLKRSAILPGVAVIAMGLTFVTPQYSMLVFLVIPVILAFLTKE